MEIVDNSSTQATETPTQTYSLSEVVKYLDINESTLRNWEKRFAESLTNYRNQYNHRAFTDRDIKTLERIKVLMASGLFTQAGIKHMLSNKGGIAVGGQQLKKTDGGLDEKYREKLLIALNSLGSEIHSLRREVREDLKDALRRDIEHLTLLLLPPEESKKSWWKWW
ncbi:MAG: MerR family transcriptional regulator [bacterium]